MSRAHSVGSFVVVLALGVPAHAFDHDGPPPINTTRSISAGADDDIITQGDVETHALTAQDGHVAGSYMGVVPGAAAVPPRAAAKRPARADSKSRVTITWPGFQMRADGSSRVFIQSTAPLAPQSSSVTGQYQVRLPGAHIAAATNRLPLDTRYFNTPVTKVSLSVDRAGATLLLDLRGEVSPHVSSESEKTGYYFTYIDLPAGSYLPKSAGSTQQTQQTGQATAAAEPAPAAPTQAAAQAATKVAAPTATTRTPMFHRTKYREPQGEMPGTLTLPD